VFLLGMFAISTLGMIMSRPTSRVLPQ